MELLKSVVSLGTLVIFTNFIQSGNDKRFADNLVANDKRFKDNLDASDKRFSDLLLTLRDTKSEDRARIDDKISMLSTAVKDMKEEKKG